MLLGKHINKYYLRFAPLLLAGLLALVAVDWLQLVVPNLYQQVINGINDGAVMGIPFDMDYLLERICLPLVGIIVCMVAGRFLWRVCFFGVAIRVEGDLRCRMFDRCKDLSSSFYQEHKVGDLMSLFTNDLDTVQECFGWGVMMFFDALLLGLLAMAKMWRMDMLLTVLAMIPMGLLLAVSAMVGRYMTKKWDLRQEAFSRMSDFSQERISGLAVIKAFCKEAHELLSFKALSRENEQANVAHTKASVTLRVLVTLFVESVVCIILGYGGYLVYLGRFNAGQLVEFIGYFTTVVWPIMAVSELIDMTSRGKASLLRIGQLLDARPEVCDRPDAQPLERPKGRIEVRDLSFCYPGTDRAVLKNLSFTIEAGQRVGLVGRTGSGKTTLADLLLRTYNVPDGTVFLDGCDINSLTLQSLRSACAYVPQDNFLFSDTIGANIAFGPGDPEKIREAAVLADVDGNITQFPRGYETVLGERGVTVSGGQKQRISIARALLADAPVLILDDALSAVDTQTEKTILENLERVRTGRTTLLTAHRVSTVAGLDKLLLLEDGCLIAQGTHRELLESCPAYQKMVRLQQLDEGGDTDA